MSRLLRGVALFLAFVAVCALAHSHSHEAPHLKYGREVNEAAQRGEDTIDHGHSHSHHGHSHDHFDDDEEEHAHAHSHGHSHGANHHGHSHGANQHAHSHSHHGHSHEDLNKDFEHKAHGGAKKPSSKDFQLYDKNGYLAFLNDPKTRLWTYALGSTFLISAIPCFFLTFIPVDADTENSSLLKFLLAFGAGGLLGDAFLHLIPHAQMHVGGGEHGHTHSHSHSHGDEVHEPHDNSVGLWVLGGLLFFFVSEKLLRILTGGSGHGHSHGEDDHSKKHKKQTNKSKKAKQSDNEASSHETDHESEEHDHKEDEAKSKRVVSWLNMGADFLHNTTDGLAIGASFIAGTTVGVFTTLMVFFHEIPHEIGDFAFLIRSGHSKRRAQLIQLLTALGAFGGCVVALQSVNAQELNESAQSSWVQPFTAGGFIYIAAVSILPELLEKSSFWLTVAEVFAMCVGVLFMHIITLYE